jgi:hypothetical protein
MILDINEQYQPIRWYDLPLLISHQGRDVRHVCCSISPLVEVAWTPSFKQQKTTTFVMDF